ncbi:MAG TPA: C39 family peptidase [Alphaproteobacteria bacterium]|nr:C39 family peptidase [Alphaproteobacteria bacterium]
MTAAARAMLLAAAIAALPVAGPAAAADAHRGPVVSLLELRQQSVVVQKYDLSCGAAALATLLRYQYGDPVTEREITRGLISRKEYIEHPELVRVRQGFSLLDMKRFVESRGYEGVGYGKLEFADLLRLAPIIVPVSPVGYNHFVIFRGALGGEVLLADPAYGNRTMSREKFERVWIEFPNFGRVGFIVARKGEPRAASLLAPKPDLFVAPTSAMVRQALPF